jgi:transcriptional regulator with XRE-family HTH domain
VEDDAIGHAIRSIRRKAGLRQVDLAERTGVSQSVISRIECGDVDDVTVATLRRVGAPLQVRISVALRWRSGDLFALRDEVHARIVGEVTRLLRDDGWEVWPEATFNEWGERGSIDILAWHEPTRTLLIVEVKSRLIDLQDTLATLDRKRRVTPAVCERDRGWRPVQVGTLLVLPGASRTYEALTRHRDVLEAALPARGVEVRRWLRHPSGDLSGILVLPRSTAPSAAPSRSRVTARRARSRP